ncbi:MAG TPA: L-glutamate gamma-semialdehyde dehydrogenase [Elusimicrobiota bacterium]|jgi:1-pyrroline-5-carboxylate dehydrogenase|nr:L-glutamate gamma-semialdehyde dehydrogenase [Elusimicrobiota bacterium]
MNARFAVPMPVNEPVLGYAPGSAERAALFARLNAMKAKKLELPLFIGGEEVRAAERRDVRAPHDHAQVLARAHIGGPAEVKKAIAAALKARKEWARLPFEARAAVFLKAADLLAGDWRWTLNAATMLNQSKNMHQAEIDSACELIDFLRFNVRFAQEIFAAQPESSRGVWNRMQYRPLEGFVFAVTPFNFTAIAGNLPCAPALMGNTVVWKPSSLATYSAHWIMKLLETAGLPPGVINLVHADAAQMSELVLAHPEFAGVHFTGGTDVFRGMWTTIGRNIGAYRNYPRIIGETGGKDFVAVHSSADPDAVAAALVRGAFEYQGQKCSAASRAYIPADLWPKIRKAMRDMLAGIEMGSPEDPGCFVNAVIGRSAFDQIGGYLDRAKKNKSNRFVAGGTRDDAKGYFIAPTVIECGDAKSETMVSEIFGPVLSVYVYPELKWKDALKLADESTAYALTGSVFARDRRILAEAEAALEYSAGNFYINDKPTGAVVGQQPFGGARASGTDDKAGSHLNLLRWVSPRTIKETFDPPRDFRYPWLARDPA